MDGKLKVGDVVKLKSGGEKMTIEEIDDDRNIDCVWFEGKKQQRGSFVEATLQKYSPRSPSIRVI